MDGTWPPEPFETPCASITEDDRGVYEELCAVDAVAADASALLEALLYGHRLVDMYEPGEEDEAAIAPRWKTIQKA